MQKLYLVGFTSDLRGLILSRQKGVKSGGFIVDLDDQLQLTLEEAFRLHGEDGSGANPSLDGEVEAAPAPARARAGAPRPVRLLPPETPPEVPSLPASGPPPGVPPAVAPGTAPVEAPARKVSRGVLTPKEIQAELRSGKSVQEVARMAGTDASWIERFLSPILAERKGIVDSVMAGVISRPRKGRSVSTVGQAILANLSDLKIAMDPEDLEDAWQVARRDGQWQVTFHYTVRGQTKQAVFGYDPDDGVQPLDADASVIGWRAPAAGTAPAGVAAVKSKAQAKAKPKAKAKPVTRREVAEASAALWGATKVTPPTAPARRTSFIGVGKADAPGGKSKQATPSKASEKGRPQPPPPVKRMPGVIDDRPVFARNSSAPRQKRLMTTADDEAGWRTAVARTRAARKGGAPMPEPPPPRERPARPQRKRLPDDWLLDD